MSIFTIPIGRAINRYFCFAFTKSHVLSSKRNTFILLRAPSFNVSLSLCFSGALAASAAVCDRDPRIFHSIAPSLLQRGGERGREERGKKSCRQTKKIDWHKKKGVERGRRKDPILIPHPPKNCAESADIPSGERGGRREDLMEQGGKGRDCFTWRNCLISETPPKAFSYYFRFCSRRKKGDIKLNGISLNNKKLFFFLFLCFFLIYFTPGKKYFQVSGKGGGGRKRIYGYDSTTQSVIAALERGRKEKG